MKNIPSPKTATPLEKLEFELDNSYLSFPITHIKELWIKKGQGQGQGQLFIILHGWRHTANDLASMAKTILQSDCFPNGTIVIPELKLKTFSCSNPEVIAKDIVLLIDTLDEEFNFKDIYLIGHSLGSLIARKVYLYAYGEVKNEQNLVKAPFEQNIINPDKKQDNYGFDDSRKWFNKVNRILLLAGVNRGWTQTPAESFVRLFGTDFYIFLDTFFHFITKQFLIFKIRRGSSFITTLRVQWIIMSNCLEAKRQQEALVIQLLGTQDDIVSPIDDIDFVTGRNFRYIDVPHTNHANIIDLDDLERQQKFKTALLYNPNQQTECLSKEVISIADLDDLTFPKPNKEINNVVFVIHGIRDQGFWTKKIARKVKLLGSEKQEENWATETSSYGYFGMLPFLFPYLRRYKVEWLMEQYTENLALYPNAKFHYVGHSNGTYLVAKALQEYPYCRFNHIVFAGSVVSSQYKWEEPIKNQQVAKILNFVATNDVVVAIFPNLFEKIPLWGWNKDLGGAGHKGFNFDNLQSISSEHYFYETNPENTIHQLKYVMGGHGAALKEMNWDTIVNFIVNGEVNLKTIQPNEFKPKRKPLAILLGTFNLIIWLILAIFIIGIGLLILNYSLSVSLRTIFFIFYLALIWRIFTRF